MNSFINFANKHPHKHAKLSEAAGSPFKFHTSTINQHSV